MIRTGLILAGFVVLTPLAAAGQDIRMVRERGAVTGCARLGEAHGSSLWGGLMADHAYRTTLEELRTKARAAGGTHVLILDTSSGMSGSRAFGEIYRC